MIPPIRDAILAWEEKYFAIARKVTKGSNPFTEHYGAVHADVVDPDDPSTQINTTFLNAVNDSDVVIATGIAGSHCLANTMLDMTTCLGDDFAKKVVFLEDCTAPVPGFEGLQDSFVAAMSAKGMKVSNSVDYLS